METTERLVVTEPATVDRDRLMELAEDMGLPAAERYLGTAIEEVVNWTTLAWAAYHAGDSGGLVRAAREVRAVSHAVGLCSLARVARDVTQTANAGDSAALAATLARMSRLADGVQYAIGDSWTATH